MANKYIYHGAAFNGDGTTSAVAASNGAPGAWNDIAYHEGATPTYGVLAAGDAITIRSKDAAGANITRSVTTATTLGSANATSALPISWIIDGGTAWPGVNGVITYARSGAMLTFRALNYFECEVQDALVTSQPSDWPGNVPVNINGYVKKIKITDANSNANVPVCAFLQAKAGVFATMDSCTIVAARGLGSGVIYCAGTGRLVNTSIEITGGSNNIVFSIDASYSSPMIEVFGGRLHGTGVGSSTKLAQNLESTYGSACKLFGVGFAVPVAVLLASNASTWSHSSVELVGMDGGVGAVMQKYWGYANSRDDNNPPTLSATLPNSVSTPWSWRLGPERASFTNPAQLTFSKMFALTAAAVTVTQEFLIATTLSATKRSVWVTLSYVDATTGLTKQVSSFSPSAAALDASTAGWSTTAWGLVSSVKRKITLTTPTTVKQDTLITVLFNCALGQATDQDVLFVDPDFSVV